MMTVKDIETIFQTLNQHGFETYIIYHRWNRSFHIGTKRHWPYKVFVSPICSSIEQGLTKLLNEVEKLVAEESQEQESQDDQL